MFINLRIQRAAVALLLRELRLRDLVPVLLSVVFASIKREPFRSFPKATDWRERGSRDQAGPAIVLYRALSRRLGTKRALEVCGHVIELGAVLFLSHSVGRLQREQIAQMSNVQREAFAKEKSGKFPNATMTWDEISTRGVRFTISKCRLAELARQTGHPELAPLFCRGDAKFFGQVEKDVTLTRPPTIADGASHCHFHIAWRDDDPTHETQQASRT